MVTLGSPLVRRLRLGAELRELRRGRGLSAADVGRLIDQSRLVVTRIESDEATRPPLDRVMSIMEACGLDSRDEQYQSLVAVARDAARRGWWESADLRGMGERQARAANLEFDTVSIREYQLTVLPGLLQFEDFIRYQGESAVARGSLLGVEPNLQARLRRQEQITGPRAAQYEAIVEEQTIRRRSVPEPIMVRQLEHLLRLAERPNIAIRVLPVDAALEGPHPRVPFSVYRYADPGDPTIVSVDTVSADILLTEVEAVNPYVDLFDRMRNTALSVEESVALIRSVASSKAVADEDGIT